MRYFILSFIALVFFVFESIFAQMFAGDAFGADKILVPHFMMIFVFFLTMYGSRKMGMLYGAILGLTYDVVYTEILGIYMFLLPFLAYLISKSMKILQNNIMVACLTALLFTAVLEVVIFQMNIILSADMGFGEFAERRLVPTLLLNLAFIIISCYPLKRMIEMLDLQGETE
ncbi:rod shape-determining protein MreD [Peribacillus frigoritolerans]|uniref:rod shape-determining protein MreD n=1 Tax=Peribacillus frigoritolerans TaxID=450367 RepID=UPI001F4FBF2A|nr:rod shape-determining protein MreD [Peribacillus frigoritolerans]MCK2016965.1 rod shape-determining protein MreD [Peribacillus frigoritolerans]